MFQVLENLLLNHLLAPASMLMAFLVSYRIYPVIIDISHKKGLMQSPGERNSHTKETPSLGGIGLFVAFSLCLALLGMVAALGNDHLIKVLSVLAAVTILLFLGIKDDLLVLAPKQKMLGQLAASCIVIFLTDVRIANFHGLLGVYELPYLISVVFTLFVFILVINAYNLIDGIDGLAGFTGILASMFFGTFFLLNDQRLFMLVSFILIGAIIGFLKYNLSDSHKLFMGDSGSLFVGYLLAYQGICFLAVNGSSGLPFGISNAPVLLLAILSFPLLDTLRVFAIRIKARKSPFTADRNHIHHRLLDIGCTHKRATTVISLAILLVIVMAILLDRIEIHLHLTLVVLIGILVYLSPFMIALKANKKRLPEKSLDYALSVKIEGLNNQLQFRKKLMATKKNNKLDTVIEKYKMAMEYSAILKEKPTAPLNNVIDKRTRILGNFSPPKKSREKVGNH